jgi:hypothetical protein
LRISKISACLLSRSLLQKCGFTDMMVGKI